MALGAQRADVLRNVLRQSGWLIAMGLVIGLGGAWALSGSLTALLFGLTPLDGPMLLVVTTGLGIVAGAAALLPARRATKIDPLVALRCE